MSIFDITPDSPMQVVADVALKNTRDFLRSYCGSLHVPQFTNEWHRSGFMQEKQVKFTDITLRRLYRDDKPVRVSRLDVAWNPKDNIVDVLVLDPKHPVLVECIDDLCQEDFKYFRFRTKSGRPIIFIQRKWKNEDILLPCKNMDKVEYIKDFYL